MTNAKKVKVSKEVAEAIEDVRSVNYTDFQIIRDIVEDEGKTAYGTKMPVLIKFAKYSTENQQTLILALANGYEVEKSPEEELASIYKYYKFEAYTTDMTAYADGIARAVSTLGLKIEGVNVK